MEPCGHQQSTSVRVYAGTMIQGQMKFALDKANMRPDNLTPICDPARNCISRTFLVSISWIWSNRKKRNDRGQILIYSEVNPLGRQFAELLDLLQRVPEGRPDWTKNCPRSLILKARHRTQVKRRCRHWQGSIEPQPLWDNATFGYG